MNVNYVKNIQQNALVISTLLLKLEMQKKQKENDIRNEKSNESEYGSSEELIEKIKFDYQYIYNFIFSNNNTLFNTKANNTWNMLYKSYYEKFITLELINEIGLNKIQEIFVSDYKNTPKWSDFINSIKTLNDYVNNQVGGTDEFLDNFNINIKEIKIIKNKNKKVISLTLLNPYFEDKNIPYIPPNNVKKPPHFYTKVLYNAIQTYRKYLPDWLIRLYIDDTTPIYDLNGKIEIDNQKSLPEETKKVLKLILNNPNCELIHIKNNFFYKKNKHIGLIPTLFRFLSMFDPDIETCFIGDIDNCCTIYLAEILKNFSKSESTFLIFKPLSSYNRTFFDEKCMDSFLAGMFGFKKQQSMIFNPIIWQCMLQTIDKFYNKMYEMKNTKDAKNIVNYNNCAIKLSINSPFFYGFDEIGMTTVIAYLINKFDLKTITVPLLWDYGMSFTELFSLGIVNNIYKFLSDEFKVYISNLIENKDIFSNYKNLMTLHTLEYAPITQIINQIIYWLVFNKKDKLNINGKTIKVFNDNYKYDTILSIYNIVPFVNVYPLDYQEIISFPQIIETYGKEISTLIINIIDEFEKEKYQEFENMLKNVIYTAKKNPNYYNIHMPYSINEGINKSIIDLSITNLPIDNINNSNYLNYIKPQYKLTDLTIFKNNYDMIIPFGHFCIVKNALNKLGYIYPTLVFDWMTSSIEDIEKVIDSNFAKFTDRTFYNKNQGYHMHNEYSNIGFVHHDLDDPVTYNNILERTERLKKCINDTNQTTLYITTLKYENDENHYNYMYLYEYYEKLRKKIFNMKYLAIILTRNRKEKKNLMNIIFNLDNFALIHLYTTEEIYTSTFNNQTDNDAYESILKNIKVSGKNILHVNENNLHINECNTLENKSLSYTGEDHTNTHNILSGGSNITPYYYKYLDYKSKYIYLKKKVQKK